MKPTQQEIIELAREQGLYLDGINTQLPLYVLKQEELVSLVHLTLERGGAGGGEPVNQWRKAGTSEWWDGFPDHSDGGGPYETRTLYTHPSPTDLRAEYLRGLDDAKKIASNYGPSRPIVTNNPSQRVVGRWEGEQAASAGIADAIEALKGKQ